jgi:uncharacterized protein (DUF736 family)
MSKTTKVGVAWKKTTPDGKAYLSVVITNPVGQDFRYTIWPVEEKRSDASPDYSVTKSTDQTAAAPVARPAARDAGDDFPSDGNSADVPF